MAILPNFDIFLTNSSLAGWFGSRNSRSRASNQGSCNKSHCFIGILKIADRQILNMLSFREGPSTAFRRPYLNTIALSRWSHCGKNAEITRTKQFWFRMQPHKAPIPPCPWLGTTRGTFCLMSVCVCVHLLTSTSLQQWLPVGMPDTAVPTDVSHIHRHGTESRGGRGERAREGRR